MMCSRSHCPRTPSTRSRCSSRQMITLLAEVCNSCSKPSSERSTLVGTTTAPARMTAQSLRMNSMQLGRKTHTRSPFFTPSAASAAARRSTWSQQLAVLDLPALEEDGGLVGVFFCRIVERLVGRHQRQWSQALVQPVGSELVALQPGFVKIVHLHAPPSRHSPTRGYAVHRSGISSSMPSSLSLAGVGMPVA